MICEPPFDSNEDYEVWLDEKQNERILKDSFEIGGEDDREISDY